MTHKRPVGEHLRNGALYQMPVEFPAGAEWKHRLLLVHSAQSQLKAALSEKISVLRWFVYVGIPGACIAAVFAAYFGFIHPGNWLSSALPDSGFTIPPIGLSEALLFSAIINVWVLFTRRRFFNI